MLYILVEGLDDKRFFENAIGHKLKEKHENIFIWEYAGKKKSQIDAFINSIRAMGKKLVFVADKDEGTQEKAIKKQLRTHPKLRRAELTLVVTEIESWYLSGVDEESTTIKLKKKIPKDTSKITKEQFENYFMRYSRAEAMIKISSEFCFERAVSRNTSFKRFFEANS